MDGGWGAVVSEGGGGLQGLRDLETTSLWKSVCVCVCGGGVDALYDIIEGIVKKKRSFF